MVTVLGIQRGCDYAKLPLVEHLATAILERPVSGFVPFRLNVAYELRAAEQGEPRMSVLRFYPLHNGSFAYG